MYHDNDECDPDLAAYARADERKLASGGSRHTCPDCGKPNALTDEEKRRGYHCSDCTSFAES